MPLVVQRIAVATSCAAFLVMEPRIANQQWMQNLLLAGVTVLACVEKLCAIMNLVSVEKDWVTTSSVLTPLRALIRMSDRLLFVWRIQIPVEVSD